MGGGGGGGGGGREKGRGVRRGAFPCSASASVASSAQNISLWSPLFLPIMHLLHSMHHNYSKKQLVRQL